MDHRAEVPESIIMMIYMYICILTVSLLQGFVNTVDTLLSSQFNFLDIIFSFLFS